MILDLLIALVALGALLIAWLSRRQADAARRDLEQLAAAAQTNFERLDRATVERLDALHRRVSALEGNPAPASAPTATVSETLYLPRPDAQGRFGEASRQHQSGNSLFELTTDGQGHGTYALIDRPEVHRFALMMPGENLTVACRGEDLMHAAGMTRVVTDHRGTAVLRDGVWWVDTPAVIHYQAR